MNIGALELLVILLIGVVPYALIIWALVDAASRPDGAWQQSGQSKVLWIVLLAVGLLVCVIGVVLALVYLIAIRPAVARQQGGPGAYGP
jgi:uncharacterized protein YybS (DUF2232 family)